MVVLSALTGLFCTVLCPTDVSVSVLLTTKAAVLSLRTKGRTWPKSLIPLGAGRLSSPVEIKGD